MKEGIVLKFIPALNNFKLKRKKVVVLKFIPALNNFKLKRKKVFFSSLFPHLTIFQPTSNTRGLGAVRSWYCVCAERSWRCVGVERSLGCVGADHGQPSWRTVSLNICCAYYWLFERPGLQVDGGDGGWGGRG